MPLLLSSHCKDCRDHGRLAFAGAFPGVCGTRRLGPGREAIINMVKRKVGPTVLNSAGKADAVIKQWEKLGKPLPTYYTKSKAA